MKGIVRAALAATLVVGTAAGPHQHQHFHAKRHEHAGLEKRVPVTVTTYVPATVTEYRLDGQRMSNEDAEEGIRRGNYVVQGESTPTSSSSVSSLSSSSSSSSTSIASSTSTSMGAQFYEQRQSSTSSSSSSWSSPTPSATPSRTGVDVNFPSDYPCSKFPKEYGAFPISWLNTGGWTSLQVPDTYRPGVSIKNIVAPISGGCRPGMFCSYSCEEGYQKTQWPETSQGATGQSVGGLWCNEQGILELTRPSHPKICEKGAGGVFIKNNLSGSASVCRTDYPASENMVIPVVTSPGGTYELTNPDSENYYVWDGKKTTAQYYVNNLNVPVEEACTWKSSQFPDSAGNWAPLNIGVGMDASGITYISLFPNSPTSTALLNFNIRITGDVSSDCYYHVGEGYAVGPNGCTTGMRRGGTVTIEFY